MKKSAPEFRYLSHKELEQLNKIQLSERDRLVLDILYESGCTVKELVCIRHKDIDTGANCLNIQGKNARNKEQRQVFLSKKLLRRMRKYCGDKDFLFCTRQSKGMTTKRARQIVQGVLGKMGVDAGPQIFRYTHIVHAYEKNIPISAIRKQVGLKRSRAIEIFSQMPVDRGYAYQRFTQ